MKNTKENVVKLLNEMAGVDERLYHQFKQNGNIELARIYRRQAEDYRKAVELLTDQEIFNDYAKIYFE